MKRITAVNIGHGSLRIREFLAAGRTFIMLSLCSMIIFVFAGASSIVSHQSASSPLSSMKGFASAVSSAFFADMLGMEMPAFQGGTGQKSFSGKQVSSFVLRMLTDVNPGSPRSLLAAGMPVMKQESALLNHASDAGVEPPQQDAPIDAAPVGTEEDAGTQVGEPIGPIGVPQDEPSDSGSDAGGGTEPGTSGVPGTTGNKVVFIYHSHSRESYNPALNKNSGDPQSSKINVSLVGKRLAEQLEKRGIGSLHSSTDYPTAIPGYQWALSYKYSKKTVQEAMSTNKGLKFFFDIHRDSAKRSATTTTIDGKDYAKVFFIIGRKNPDWKQNEQFAEEINKKLNKLYPGVSRGIWGKDVASGNGEYNQSLASDSVLIEVGGVDNTLEECYRTADALAEVIAELYFKTNKV